MPMFAKKLHVAPNLEVLQEKANLDKKKILSTSTDKLCNSAKTILREAEKKYKEHDEEMAFIYYFKFLDLVLHLKKKPDFEKNPLWKFLSESALSAINVATELKSSLSQRYASLDAVNEKKEIAIEENLAGSSAKKNSEVREAFKIEELEKSTDLTINATADRSISASRLLNFLTDYKCKILILDVRPGKDFEESHIKHSACVSVPQEILRPGMTGQQLEKQLPSSTAAKWGQKNVVDHVIMLDWNTKELTKSNEHPLHILEEAMVKWDLQNPLKNSPLTLIGGYKEWLLRYPMYTTKALDILSLEAPKQMSVIPDVSGVDYPDLDAALNEEIGAATVQNNQDMLSRNQLLKRKVVNGWVSDHPDLDTKHQPSVNRLVKPTVSSSPNAVFSTGRPGDEKKGPMPNKEAGSSTKNQVPQINRSLKPSWAVKSEQFTEALSEEETVVKETLNITEEQLNKEKEFAQLRLRKELEAEESKRIELQKQEELLLENLKRLQEINLEHETRYAAVKEENMKMKKLLEDQSNEEQKEKEKEIQIAIAKKKDLQKEMERLRQERKLKEKQDAEAKAKSSQFIVYKSETEVRSPQQDHPSKEQGNYPSENEYTMPLKDTSASSDGSNRGLTRSYSSPNIAQMVADLQRIPAVDRSLKPKFDYSFKPDEISSVKMRNLNPIYGHIPNRPVTGLRNLGNTCYMNSIIQCLSNTEQFANYFVQGRYKQDIKRNNKQGTNGEIVEDFAIIIRALWAGQYKSFSPKDFKNIVSKYIPMCVGSEQQDSHEFLVVLMDKLHGDLNKGRNVEPLPDLDSLSDLEATEKFWNHHRIRNCSKMSETFEGLLKSTLTCLSCRKTSHSYEVFSCLSLPISSNHCTLKNSMLTFLKPEKMSGEGAWDCPSCRQKKEAEKTLMLSKLPEVLIIQLKRFSYEGMWRRKIQSLVDFPQRLELPPDSNRGKMYSLYGIVNHFGYLEGGHYTAFCKNYASGKWYKYDDHEVSEISQSETVTSAAYLLFYASQETRM